MSTKKSTETTETDKSNLICLMETQAVEGRNDSYCIGCWNEAYAWFHTYGLGYSERWGYVQSYVDRDDCMDENLVTAEEFEKGVNKC